MADTAKPKKTSTPRTGAKRKSAPRAKSAPVRRASEKPVAQKDTPKPSQARKYFSAVGRRKESVARVILTPSSSAKQEVQINGKELAQYFPYPDFAQIATAALASTGMSNKMNVQARLHGGGQHGQAVAMRMAIARALVIYDAQMRPQLRALGYLTRDSRAKERKKPGLKRARRAPQFSKR